MSAAVPHPQILRGLQLKQLGRFADAEDAFKEALAQEPNDAFALHHLAGCQWQMPARRKEALASIDRAISIEPNESSHYVLRAFILCSLERPKEALGATDSALTLDPNDASAYAAQAQAYLHLENWAQAERAARQALALDADNSGAANQLAQALRLQNKQAETDAHLAGMLARDPEDAFTHANAGWSALHRGAHREAEVHFREALRLDPDFDYAREGLLNSFRARSPLYAAYLKYCFAMARLSRGTRWAVIVGLYFAQKIAATIPGGSLFVALYFLFVLWVWVARPVGNAMLLFDRFARYALRPAEKIEAAVVTGSLTIGVVALVTSFVVSSDAALFIGFCGIAAAFPLSLVFTNASRAGRWIFGGVAVLSLVATGFAIVAPWLLKIPPAAAANIFVVACIACLASTWLGNIPALHRRR
jgi:tetratricopeptide (TPR) repeat protein